ncbi:MAG: DUF4270 domain-containing protein [Carboxylicivirga sp.]|nr:DUF4270 domain-containing protein [Carboxylicivirga sp.]
MKRFSLRNIMNTAGQFLLIGLLSFTVACKDEPARLTGDVLPDGEKIKGLNYDGHILKTTNTNRAEVRTSQATYGIVGIFDDPDFGKSEGSFVTDFSIGKEVRFTVDILDLRNPEDTVKHDDYVFHQFNNNVDTIADTWSVDSLVLNLQYQFNNWYGKMELKQDVNIYELTTPLGSNNQEFFSNHEVDGMYNPNAVGSKEVYPNMEVPDSLRSNNWGDQLFEYPDSLWNYPQYLWNNDKVKAAIDSTWLDSNFTGNTTKTKYWSFKLKDDLADKIFTLPETSLKSSSTFKNEFKGVYVALDEGSALNGNGWLTKINLLSGSGSIATNMTIHLKREYKYLNAQKEIRDTSSTYLYTFPINVENVRFNKYEHEESIDVANDDPERLYIQGMAGTYMKMQLPDDVTTWVDSIGNPEIGNRDDYHMAANIEFFMEIDTVKSKPDYYPTPNKLVIKWKDNEDNFVDPIHTIRINDVEVNTPVFGTTDSQGNRIGDGERVIRLSEDGNPEYYYRFIMRSDYFNYIMRHQDGANLNEKEFFIGPENTTANFQRVILFSGSKKNESTEVVPGGETEDKRMRMNVKYYQYRPR